MQEYKCHNADILLKEDSTVDDLIDIIEVSVADMLLYLSMPASPLEEE